MTDNYSANVQIAFGHLTEVVRWCENNCEKSWGFNVIEIPDADGGYYTFNFDSDRDAVKFAIWKM